MSGTDTSRINKYIASSGLCSRREADRLIEEGRVTVNGIVAESGMQVCSDDVVLVDGKNIIPEANDVYIAFNKPLGVTCTTDSRDPSNIIDYIGYPERIFPIGRLDKNSSGLILLTNDGSIVNTLLRAENNHEKEYQVTVDRPYDDKFIKEMQVFLVAFISYKPKSRVGDKSWRQIRWSLGAVPLGGLTVFKTRQADAAADSRKYGPSVNRWRDAATSPYLDDKPAWQRLFISAAGVMVNIIMFGLFYFVLPSFLPLHMHRMIDSIAFLSLVLALLNILPIYPLDGGAILFALYEIITGRKPSPTFTKYCGMIGFAFIILFFWVFPHWMNGFLDKILEIFF